MMSYRWVLDVPISRLISTALFSLNMEVKKMFRSFIQCAAFLQAAISAVFLIKAGIIISVKDMAELAMTRWTYSLPVLKNLAQQRADTRVGFSLLLLSVVLQSLHWLLPFGIDDLRINLIGVIIAFVFSGLIGIVAYVISLCLQQKWYKQADDILNKLIHVQKNK